mmetsp:Transcript_20155/g.20255  ORF Transcript_20155/g.20255 Transcript_20155/m.20255 type:complete len:734 (-) Transcript_20155:177-2378(-)
MQDEEAPLISTYGALEIAPPEICRKRDNILQPLPEKSTPIVEKARLISGFTVAFLLSLLFYMANNASEIRLSKNTEAYESNFGSLKGMSYLGAFSHPHWKVSSTLKLADTLPHTFYVSLKLKDEHKIHDHLMSVSDPTSAEYGHYLSMEEINNLYTPMVDDQISVIDFFEQIQDSQVHLNAQGDMIRVEATKQNIEKALNTKLEVHHHIHLDVKTLRATQPLSIPEHVSEKLNFISLNTPVLHLTSNLARKQTELDDNKISERMTQQMKTAGRSDPDTLQAADGSYAGSTPEYLSKLYGVQFPAPNNGLGSQAVISFLGQMFSNTDLKYYFILAGIKQLYNRIADDRVFGFPNNPRAPKSEASLDTQLITAIAPGIPTYVYSMLDLNPWDYANEGFLAYCWLVGNQTFTPYVHSISYGDDESTVFNPAMPGSFIYGHGVEGQFKLMGLRGVTVLAASGDSGIGGLGPTRQRCAQAWPSWPASSPYVTSVGGTMIVNGEEVVCSSEHGSHITAGGGFSNVLDRSQAPWQEDVVSQYLSKTQAIPQVAGYFNTKGRAYPDVSLIADDYPIVLALGITNIAGTSASAPLLAAMISLMNDARLKQGKSVMGFINPFLYHTAKTTPSAFNDITSGDIRNGMFGNIDCDETKSFYATVGWDAATGLGSVNYPELLAAALSEVEPQISPSKNNANTTTKKKNKKKNRKNKKNKKNKRNKRRKRRNRRRRRRNKNKNNNRL